MEFTCSFIDLAAISYLYLGWLDKLKRYNESDDWITAKTTKVTDGIRKGTLYPALDKYFIDNSFLCYKMMIVLGYSPQ